MGNSLKSQILAREGIVFEDTTTVKAVVKMCPRCNLSNALENKYCSAEKCGYPLSQEALDKIKKREIEKDRKLEEVWQALYKQGIIKKE